MVAIAQEEDLVEPDQKVDAAQEMADRQSSAANVGGTPPNVLKSGTLLD